MEVIHPAFQKCNFQAIDVHADGNDMWYKSSIMEMGGCDHSCLTISASLLYPEAFTRINGFALSGGAQRIDMCMCTHHLAQGATLIQKQHTMVRG